MPRIHENGPTVVKEYDELAASYDEKWAFYTNATIRETLRRLPDLPGRNVLDVACGTGALLHTMQSTWPKTKLTGIDLSKEMLAQAKSRLSDRVDLRNAPVHQLPFRDEHFDMVVNTNSFHFFPACDEALLEMKRVIRPGGKLVITDWCDDFVSCRAMGHWLRLTGKSHHTIFKSMQLHSLIEQAGLRIVSLDIYKINWLWGLMTAIALKPEESL